MERSFAAEVAKLRLGAGETFEGEGILAITKGLLQSGVAYVGGYQGAPVSHLMDVLSDARPLLDELGVHFEVSANEAAAAALLAASIHYPMRGAVVWKSTAGTNVAADALGAVASSGVKGGALVVVGEDYGDGSSIVQERTYAYALKSSIWLLDPKPDQTRVVDLIEQAFELSEASASVVMMQFRIRACHVEGSFAARDNIAPAVSALRPIEHPVFDVTRLNMPPVTFLQEREKVDDRLPAALAFIRDRRMNDHHQGQRTDLGIIVQGGLYNSLLRALAQLGLADVYGGTEVPLLALNVTYPLLPEEIVGFCVGKRDVLVVEEGNPAYIEDAVEAILRRADLQTRIAGKSVLPRAGEYTTEVLHKGLALFLDQAGAGGSDLPGFTALATERAQARGTARELIGAAVPKRPPGFCTGCPERPVFSAIKLVERELGPIHTAGDVGCHTFAALPPFNVGNTVVAYGLGLSSLSAVSKAFGRRTLSIMGDGGFWHQGLTSGVAGAVQNDQDAVLMVIANGYTSATGQQYIPSSRQSARISIQGALKSMGVKWVQTRRSYGVADMVKTLREAMTTPEKGLKVIVAEGECQLARQRRLKPIVRTKLAAGERVVRERFGVDDAVCTGDHSCIRLSGCPSLTVRSSRDPLKDAPVASVNNDCVGCGVCGEVAEAAALCPSFYKAEIVQNPGWADRLLARVRQAVIGVLQTSVPA